MKKYLQPLAIVLVFIFLFTTKESKACYSYFTHTNACAGDTVWFAALDHYAVYAWSYGDTSAGSSNWSFDSIGYHVYNTTGTYWVTLFTNIGAEWDYYTTQVTVYANCFEAHFSSSCNGNYSYNFYDNSVGNPTTWAWDFGDPASGAANSSNIQNPFHIFSSGGSFNVQLIIGDGTQLDTLSQSVDVYNTCISASFYYNGMYLNCVNDTFFPPVTYNGAITNYLWNFGDPSSGTADTSTSSSPFHIYNATGNYTVTLTISDGTQTQSYNFYATIFDCRCWPGDNNRNGVVDGDDIFPIGIYYGHSGTPRTGATTNWTGQTAQDWPGGLFVDYMYLQDFMSLKFADANGDGVIDSLDADVVMANCGMTHGNSNARSENLFADSNDPTLSFQNTQTWAVNNVWIDVPIDLSKMNDTVRNAYGLNVTIDIDDTYLDSVYVTFQTWMGNSADLISMFKYLPAKHQLIISQVRKDGTKISGYGNVAIIHLRFNNAPIWGSFNMNFNPSSKLITNGMYVGQNNLQKVLPLYLGSICHLDLNPEGLGKDLSNTINLRIFPNPVQNQITYLYDNAQVYYFEVVDLLGRTVMHISKPYYNPLSMMPIAVNEFDVSQLMAGTYLLKAVSDKGVSTMKFVKE